MAREYTLRRVQQPWTRTHNNFVLEERSLNLATAVRVNLFALPGPIAFPSALASLSQFLVALRGKWTGRLRIAEYMLQAPGFIRNPVAEMLGLAVSIEVASDYGWDGEGPQSIDSLRQFWGKEGARPDLLFTCEGSDLQFVGEAKGRLQRSPRPSAPHLDERTWLEALSEWYDDLGLQYFLLLAIGTPEGVVANLYDPGEPQSVYPRQSLERALASRERRLWETAPSADAVVAGQEIRGRWVPVIDVAPGDRDRPSWLFIGLLNGPGLLTPTELANLEWQFSARGRVVVALRQAEGGLAEPPSVSELAGHLSEQRFLITRGGESIATGAPLTQGRFRVFEGSISRQPRQSVRESDRALRRELLESGVLSQERAGPMEGDAFLADDWDFPSPSAAARFVLGTSADGLTEWQLPDGTLLRSVTKSM